ncbi:MAG: transketolase C-terminal domain-containing protein, partial [Planctomycetota bacterium]
KVALERDKGPVALVLTRQKVPQLDRSRAEDGLAQGAYVLSDPPDGVPRLILMGSGSEVHLLVAAEAELAKDGVRARVVSMPSMELFAEQRKSVQDEVLPPSIPKRLAVEAASPLSWYPFVGEQGDVIGMDRFGASAPYERIFEELNLTVEEVVRRARRLVE